MQATRKRNIFILAMLPMLLAHPFNLSAQQSNAQDHAARITALADQLRLTPEIGPAQIEMIQDQVTQSLFSEVDAYIVEAFSPLSATVSQIKAGLDAVLGHTEGDGLNNIVFSVNLPSGRFLIVGVEVEGGGTDTTGEYGDKVTFRAYSISRKRFAYVASIASMSEQPLDTLYATPLPVSPVPGQFWFMAWADVPPLSPYQIAMRLYAFNGKSFRTIWSPKNIISPGVDDAVQIAPNGRVTINRMPVWDSQTVLHDQYTVTPGGLKKVAESTTGR